MPKRVAIVEVAQISGGDSKDNFYDQAYWVTKQVLDKAGLKREEQIVVNHAFAIKSAMLMSRLGAGCADD